MYRDSVRIVDGSCPALMVDGDSVSNVGELKIAVLSKKWNVPCDCDGR